MKTRQKTGTLLKLALLLVIPTATIFASVSYGSAAEIAIDRAEFVNLLTSLKVMKENLSNASSQLTLYKKLDADQKRLIVLHTERIKELEAFIASTDSLAAEFKETMEKTELVLDETDRSLNREKRLSRYKTYAIIGGMLVWLFW